ncbi:MAG TPA: hypothetical protein VHW74_06800 [Mycobacteriales bacterium]|jgi:hypothetical protein|nr:hypothetical protein [Mycobacteriales bacterium]
MAERGWFTTAYGPNRYHWMAQNLALAMRRHMPGVPSALITDEPSATDKRLFDVVAPLDLSRGSGMWQKFWLDDYAPFDESLYIDSDCLPVMPIGHLFDLFAEVPFGVVGRNGTQADPTFLEFTVSDLSKLPPEWHFDSYPLFNGGLFLIRRSDECHRIFDDARFLSQHFFDYGLQPLGNGEISDEPALSLAMAKAGVRAIDRAPMPVMRVTVAVGGSFKVDVTRRRPRADAPAQIVHFAGGATTGRIYGREARTLRLVDRSVPSRVARPIAAAVTNAKALLAR